MDSPQSLCRLSRPRAARHGDPPHKLDNYTYRAHRSCRPSVQDPMFLTLGCPVARARRPPGFGRREEPLTDAPDTGVGGVQTLQGQLAMHPAGADPDVSWRSEVIDRAMRRDS